RNNLSGTVNQFYTYVGFLRNSLLEVDPHLHLERLVACFLYVWDRDHSIDDHVAAPRVPPSESVGRFAVLSGFAESGALLFVKMCCGTSKYWIRRAGGASVVAGVALVIIGSKRS